MKKFAELTEPDQIKHVKYCYIDIIGEIHANKKEIEKYLPDIVDGKSDEKEARKSERDALMAKISTITLKEDCMCEPRELEIDVNYIGPELECLIDHARERAEKKSY